MQRVLYVLPPSPVAPDFSGAASRFAANFKALQDLSDEIHVIRFFSGKSLDPVLAFEASSANAVRARGLAASWHDVQHEARVASRRLLFGLARHIGEPIRSEFPHAPQLGDLLAGYLQQIRPHLIWAETAEMAAAVTYASSTTPWVYSHHDWAYLVRQVRHPNKTFRDLWLLRVCQAAEETIALAATHVVTGSTTDEIRLRGIGCNRVSVIPTAYETPPKMMVQMDLEQECRVVHLGSLETTANRSGLESYLRKAHLNVIEQCGELGYMPRLHVVGDESRLKEPLSTLLVNVDAVLTGFVQDLASVLRPYDVAILPYEHDTGYRTKLPLLMSYGQVVVATKAAVAGSLTGGLSDVCILLDRVEDFPDAIAHLVANPGERKRMGKGARAFFEDHFTHAAVRSSYSHLLASMQIGFAPGS